MMQELKPGILLIPLYESMYSLHTHAYLYCHHEKQEK